jgi:hypothetical protein
MGRSRATSLDHWGGPGSVTSKGLLAAVLVVAVALVGCTPSQDPAPSGTIAEASGASDPPASGSPPPVANAQ